MRIGHRLFTEAQVLTQLSGPLRVTEPDDTPQERAVCEAVLAQADPSLPRDRRTRAVLASDDLGRTWQVAATPHGREDPGYRGSIFEGGGIHSGGPGAGWSSLDPLTLTWGPPTDFGRTFLQRADRQSALLPNTARKLDLEDGREIAPGRTVGLYTGGSPRRPKQRIMWFTDGRLTRSVPVRFKARTRAITVVGPQELVRDGYCRLPRTAISRGFSQLMPGDAGRVLFAISGTPWPRPGAGGFLRGSILGRTPTSSSSRSSCARRTAGARGGGSARPGAPAPSSRSTARRPSTSSRPAAAGTTSR